MPSPKKQPVVEDIVSVFQTTQNQPWSVFSEKLNNVSNKDSKQNNPTKSENTITLSSDDFPVFGLVPRLDKVMLVSCNECAMIVKRDCIHSHFYRRHNSSNVSHSEADKFSLVNFLCTVKTNKNKKLKMTVRKPAEKKINEGEKVDTVVKEIKTEFNQVEYERIFKTNRTKIKQENTTEYVDRHDVEMATTNCKPSTSSGVFDWDVKPCMKSSALDQCINHKINDKIIEHNTDSNKFSSVSLDNKEDIQSNKYLKIQNIDHTVNRIASPSDLLKQDPNEKMKHGVDFECFANKQVKFNKKDYSLKNEYKQFPFKEKNIKGKNKLIIKNEYSEMINNPNCKGIPTSCNQTSNTPAVDVKIDNYKLFSGLQNTQKHAKFGHKHLDTKNEMPMDSGNSATSYHKSAKLPKVKEEFQITTINKFPDVKIKEEFQIKPINMYPDVKIKEEFQITPTNMYPDVKIKEEYDENNDKCKVEFYQPPTKLIKRSSDNNYSEVISNTYSANTDNNHSSTSSCSVVRLKEETTFTENSENIMNNKSSGDTVICNNQSSIASLVIKEETKPSLTTDNINEVSKHGDINRNEESNPSLNIDLINGKSKYPLSTDYNITDNYLTQYQQIFSDSALQISPSYKCLNDELNVQIKKNLNNQLNLQVGNNLNVEFNLKVKEDLNDKHNLPGEDKLNEELNFQGEDSSSDELNLKVEKDEIDWHSIEDRLIFLGEDESSIDLDYQDEDYLSDEFNSQSDNDLDDELHFEDKENMNVELHLRTEENLNDLENLSNEEDLSNVEDFSDSEDLNDEENFSGKDNLSSNNIGTNNNLKYNCLIPSQLPNNKEEIKLIPSKESSVIRNNENSIFAFTGHDQSPTKTLDNAEESKAKSKIDDDFVIIGNDGIVNNFENEYYQYDHEIQIYTPNYKYSDVISNDSSDNSNESLSSYDQSSVESLDACEKTNYSSMDTSTEYVSDESLYNSQLTTSSSDQSITFNDTTTKTKSTQTNLLEKHEQFMGHVEILTKSFDHVDGKNKCTQTNAPLECINCYDSTDDYVDRQININSAPNSNIQIDGYGVNNFTPISSSAQIINNKIIPMDVEEYELKDSNDTNLNISNKSHYSSHFYPHSCNPASQNNNLMRSPINENNCILFDDELNAYKPNEYITIDEAIPFIDKNNEMYKEFMKIVDKKSVNDRKCKIMPFVRIAKNLKKNLKRQVADNKENRNHLISRGIKKFKFEFIERDFSCSDESNNNDNVNN
ncbi:PREDICTED: putative uncharacterized protein DDB_G0282133 isoform X3 [Diuraphis noxia]|uniref:putative uncharacterized protein DDB_G0282133 isoform X3 n=1 Tax=Diuraphis noxia TaxID=143948 RepID=UPI0007636BCC|nr:PREDICTED: putative uncharacterized protein DDB_G0282133 isoform X3 [Diuraphis noxia]